MAIQRTVTPHTQPALSLRTGARPCAALLLMVAATASAQSLPDLSAPELRDYYRSLPSAWIDTAIRDAIEGKGSKAGQQHADFRTTSLQYAAFAKALEQAEIPFCLHAQGLKFQPTAIGPIGVNGVAALPFVAVAAVRGKCKM